ncbi:Solute carrier family 22 member 13 [Chionoecetes opilio]|uniref:Solute carrier family 22 member 13 n=1 Tax=Chionoecetes opilio TaxID=41210 RepID=A0A8J4Y4V0_CHIOP|nr:Solute carrier family 22 member 13 [Chionoecetes opilio]
MLNHLDALLTHLGTGRWTVLHIIVLGYCLRLRLRYSRKRTVMFGYVALTVLGLVSAWLPLLSLILVARFCCGTLDAFCTYSSYILLMEVMEPKRRTFAAFGINTVWGVTVMLYGGLGYLIRDWRILQTAATLPGLLILPALWVIDESPLWLIVNGRPQEALQVFCKVARWHGVDLPPEAEMKRLVEEQAAEGQNTAPKHSSMGSLLKSVVDDVVILLKTPRLRTITLTIYFIYIVVAMVYYEYSTTLLALAMVGKMAISISFQMIIFFSSELFPTEVRSRGVSTAFMMVSMYPWAPFVIFGSGALLAGAGTFLLPETRGQVLPDTVAHLEARERMFIFANSLEVLVMALEALHEEAKPLGLEVSWHKTKIQVFGGLLDGTVQSVHACSEVIEILESFTYLGSAVHNDGGSRQEDLRRIGIAHGSIAMTCHAHDDAHVPSSTTHAAKGHHLLEKATPLYTDSGHPPDPAPVGMRREDASEKDIDRWCRDVLWEVTI